VGIGSKRLKTKSRIFVREGEFVENFTGKSIVAAKRKLLTMSL